jgi:hypothetical protein
MKKFIATILTAASVVTIFATGAVSANNHDDKEFGFTLPAYDWYVRYTVGEKKMDTTPSYVKFYDSVYGSVKEYGVQFSVHGGYNKNNCIENCTCYGTSCIIKPKTARRIHTNVKEWGYSYAFLGASAPNSYVAGKSISGLWSPDTIGDAPFAN